MRPAYRLLLVVAAIIIVLMVVTGQPTIRAFDQCANKPGTQYFVPLDMVQQGDSCFRAVTR
jgi:hypothetical protein